MAEIGLFGGTFDPVHNGHLQCADAAVGETGISSVIFIPAARPPHKDDEAVCSFEHRLAMLRICLADYEMYRVSDIEGRRTHPSFTLETIRIFIDQKSNTVYHFIIGCDAFLEIESWYRWREVAQLINFVVVTRPGYDPHHLNGLLARIGFLQQTDKKTIWHNEAGDNKVQIVAAETQDISSSEIRMRIHKNREYHGCVPEDIKDYIQKNELYR